MQDIRLKELVTEVNKMSDLRAELKHAGCGGQLEIVIRVESIERIHAIYKDNFHGTITGKGSVTDTDCNISVECKKCGWNLRIEEASSYKDALDFLCQKGFLEAPEWKEV